MIKGYLAIAAAITLAFVSTIPSVVLADGEGSHTVFVTSRSQKGDFGGLENADAICQEEAGMPLSIVPEGRYLAWLSDGQTDPQERFTGYAKPVVLPDGTRIADNFSDLTDGTIQHPINMDATGEKLGSLSFWTGTNADGSHAGLSASCHGWTNTRTRGVSGSTSATDLAWTFQYSRRCFRPHRLVCFQQ